MMLNQENISPSISSNFLKLIFGETSIPKAFRIGMDLLIVLAMIGIAKVAGIIGVGLLVFLVVAGPLAISVLWKTAIGVYILIIIAFFLSVFNRLTPGVPLGIGIDFLILLMGIGLFFRCYLERSWAALKTPVTWIIVVWLGYNVLAIANPIAPSRVAWFYVVRPVLAYAMLFFFTNHIMKSIDDIRRILMFFFGVVLIAAGWGIYQAWFGLFQWELNYLYQKDLVHLVFNYGVWRSIGPIGSPAQYGIIMAEFFTMAIILAGAYKKRSAKIYFYFVGFFCLLAMVYSGTRSAYIIPPLSLFTYIVIKRNPKYYLIIVAMAMGLVVIANIESHNFYINRIQTIFKASEDKSYQIREENRAIIMPWIARHPIGGGLGSTGVWGQRFSPNTFLANFPPDSGLIRVAVELGWIGLIIFLTLYALVLLKGVIGYWRTTDPQFKAIIASILSGIAPLLLVETSQEVVGVFPMSLLFWIMISIMFSAIKLSKNQVELKKSNK
ncbi:MAG: O-antigen ligase family protein [bacterium]|nr:O-antigen ligase family protein [bacterium]